MAPTPTTPNRSQRSSKVEKNESSSTSAYSSRYLDRTPGKFSESSTKLHQSLHNSHLTHHQLLSSSSSSHAPHPSDALSGVAGLSNAIVSYLLSLNIIVYCVVSS